MHVRLYLSIYRVMVRWLPPPFLILSYLTRCALRGAL